MTGAKVMCARHEQFHEIGTACPWCEPEPRRVYSVPAPTFEITTPWMQMRADGERALRDYGALCAEAPIAAAPPEPWEGLKAWMPSSDPGSSVFFGIDSARAVRAADDVQSRREMLGGVRYDTAPSFDEIAVRLKHMWRKMSDAEALLPTTPFVLVPRGVPATPLTPTGQAQAISDWVAAGYLSRESARDMMGLPRIEARDDCPPDYVYAVQPNRYVVHPSAAATVRVTLPTTGGDDDE